MKTNTDWIEPDKIYHIYNRSINNEKLFKIESNYSLFLKNYSKYIELIADAYAYCLLDNHFHFCIKTFDEKIIRENLLICEKEKFKIKYNKEVDFETLTKMEQKIENRSVSWHISNVFASFFKSLLKP